MKQKIILAVSVLLGLIAAFLTGSYISSKENALREEKAAFNRVNRNADAIVLLKTLPAGTRLAMKDLGAGKFPAHALREQAIRYDSTSALRLVGRTLSVGVEAGRPLLWSDIEGGNPENGGLASVLRRKMRAISVSVNGVSSVSYMVRPNDRVDVLGTFTLPSKQLEGTTELVTMTILQDVLVLATGQSTGATPDNTMPAYSQVTLEVTPHEAEVLTFAEQMRGRLTLTLRNPDDLHYEKNLQQINFAKIRESLEALNENRQKRLLNKTR